MVNTMDNVGWNRTRGDVLHPATIVKRAGFRKCLVGAVGSMRRRCVAAAPAWGQRWTRGTVNRFPAEALSHCVSNRLRTQSSWGRKERGPRAVIYFRKGENMRVDCEVLRMTMRIVFLSGLAIGLFGLYEPAWSASDPATAAGQDQSTVQAESSGSSRAGAEEKGIGGHRMRKACAEDVKQLCPGVKAGEGRIAQCLKSHAGELSQTCAEMIRQRGKGRSTPPA